MKIKDKKTEDRYLQFALKLHARKRGFKGLMKQLANSRISLALGRIMMDEGLISKSDGIWHWIGGKPTIDMAKMLRRKIRNRSMAYEKVERSGKIKEKTSKEEEVWSMFNAGKHTIRQISEILNVKLGKCHEIINAKFRNNKIERTFFGKLLFEKNITLTEINQATGVSYPVLENLKFGRPINYRHRTLRDIAAYLNCTVAELMNPTVVIAEEKEKIETIPESSDILNLADIREEWNRIMIRAAKIDAVLKAVENLKKK